MIDLNKKFEIVRKMPREHTISDFAKRTITVDLRSKKEEVTSYLYFSMIER